MTRFAAGVTRKSISARPASAWLALVGIAAVNGVTACNSFGNGPTESMPGTAISSAICCPPIDASPPLPDTPTQPRGTALAILRLRGHRLGDAELRKNLCHVDAAHAAADRLAYAD